MFTLAASGETLPLFLKSSLTLIEHPHHDEHDEHAEGRGLPVNGPARINTMAHQLSRIFPRLIPTRFFIQSTTIRSQWAL